MQYDLAVVQLFILQRFWRLNLTYHSKRTKAGKTNTLRVGIHPSYFDLIIIVDSK